MAERISARAGVPLLTAVAGENTSGDSCEAYSQHGFRGIERQVMGEIRRMMLDGIGPSRQIALDPD